MAARKLIVFKHESALGNAPAHTLFDAVSVDRVTEGAELPARRFSDYNVSVDKSKIPSGVEVIHQI
jgi:CRISPR-associated protein Csd2